MQNGTAAIYPCFPHVRESFAMASGHRRATRKSAARRTRPGRQKAGGRKTSGKRWSQRVTKESDALDLKKGVFKQTSAKKIAASLKRSAEHSSRRKSGDELAGVGERAGGLRPAFPRSTGNPLPNGRAKARLTPSDRYHALDRGGAAIPARPRGDGRDRLPVHAVHPAVDLKLTAPHPFAAVSNRTWPNSLVYQPQIA